MDIVDSVSSNTDTVRPGRPRSEQRRTAILEAAAELALSGGSLPTMDAIAARAGVSRTTLYRWWPSAGAVLLEGLLEHFHESIEFDDDLPVREALTAQVDALVHLLRDTSAGMLLRQLMAASITERDVAAAMLEHWLEPRRHAAMHHLERGIATGVVRAGTDTGLVTDTLFAPAYYRLIWGHTELGDDLAEQVCALVWPGIAT